MTAWLSVHAVAGHPRIRISGPYREATDFLERQPRAQLDLPPRSGGLRDRAELRSVHKSIRCAQVRVVEAVEEFAAELEPHSFGNAKVANHREVKSLGSRPVDRVSTHIPKREGGRRHKRGGVEP